MQNKIIRIMTFTCLKDRVNMNSLYKSMCILKIRDVHELEMVKFMHSYYHKKLPAAFDEYFKPATIHHNYTTRSTTNQNYFLQRMNTNRGQSSCSFAGTKIWNTIPLEIKLLSLYSFTNYFKKILIDIY